VRHASANLFILWCTVNSIVATSFINISTQIMYHVLDLKLVNLHCGIQTFRSFLSVI